MASKPRRFFCAFFVAIRIELSVLNVSGMVSEKHVGAEIIDSDELNGQQSVCALRVRGADKVMAKPTAALPLITVCALFSYTFTLTWRTGCTAT